MITESYINAVFTKTINKSLAASNDLAFLEATKVYITKYKTNNSKQFPIEFANKADLLLKIIDQRLKEVPIDFIIDELNFNTLKYKDIEDFVRYTQTKNLTKIEIRQIENIINKPTSKLMISNTRDRMKGFVKFIEDAEFSSTDEALDIMNKTCGDLYEYLREENRKLLKNQGDSCNTSSKGETHIKDTMIDYKFRNDPASKIPTGFTKIDEVMKGGFSKGRLYCIAGQTKSGKSTMLTNFMLNAAQEKYNERPNSNGKPKLFIHLSLENSRSENFARCFCCSNDLTEDAYVNMIPDSKENIEGFKLVEKAFTDKFDKANNIVDLCYFPPGSSTVFDLESYINTKIKDYSFDYGTEVEIGAIYVDYLNLLVDTEKGEGWQVLGAITQKLKSLSEKFVCPVITATQIKRTNQEFETASGLHMDQVGESAKIGHNVDGLFMMASKSSDKKTTLFKIELMRNHESGIAYNFDADFACYKFRNCRLEVDFKQQVVDSTNLIEPKNVKAAMKKPLFAYQGNVI